MGELGATSPMIPVELKVRSLDAKEKVVGEKNYHFNVMVHQKWTPTLMMLTLYNSLSQLNEFADEATYRLNGKVEMAGASRTFGNGSSIAASCDALSMASICSGVGVGARSGRAASPRRASKTGQTG